MLRIEYKIDIIRVSFMRLSLLLSYLKLHLSAQFKNFGVQFSNLILFDRILKRCNKYLK